MNNYAVGKREKLDNQNLTKEEKKTAMAPSMHWMASSQFNRDTSALLGGVWGRGV